MTMLFALAAATLAAASPAPAASLAAAPALPPPERRQELLFEAARLGRTEIVTTLLPLGVDVNGRDARGFTPLILAAYGGHAATVEALLAAKADPCLPDTAQGNTAQMGVAFKGNDAIAARLLKTKCPVDARNKAGQTALMMAALFGRTAQVDMLIAAGADPGAIDMTGRSAASVAAAQGNAAVVERLERKR